MKTIKQQVEVSFKLLDFSDKVMLLPIMNMLAESVKENENIEITITAGNTWYLEPKYARKALKVLSDLGCRTPIGENYEDIIKSNNSQEKEEPYILHLLNWGNSKLETVKVIKQQLCLDLRQAKDLVDNCPIDIDLHEYTIAQNKYKDVLASLVEIGVHAYLTTKEQ